MTPERHRLEDFANRFAGFLAAWAIQKGEQARNTRCRRSFPTWYRLQITWILSTLHRLTGIALAVGSCWLLPLPDLVPELLVQPGPLS
jgi:hypothetical protein